MDSIKCAFFGTFNCVNYGWKSFWTYQVAVDERSQPCILLNLLAFPLEYPQGPESQLQKSYRLALD